VACKANNQNVETGQNETEDNKSKIKNRRDTAGGGGVSPISSNVSRPRESAVGNEVAAVIDKKRGIDGELKTILEENRRRREVNGSGQQRPRVTRGEVKKKFG